MEIYPSGDYNLQRLQKWLEFELSASTLLFLSWFWGPLIFLMVIAALIFIPFMLKILFEERKFGWIISFAVVVLLPAVVVYYFEISSLHRWLFGLIPLALFFFYCFMLRFAVRNWIAEYQFSNRKDLSAV